MTPAAIILSGLTAAFVAEPEALARPGDKTIVKFVGTLPSKQLFLRAFTDDELFRRDVKHAELRYLGFFAEARKILLHCDGAVDTNTLWNEKALVNAECESRERLVEFRNHRHFSGPKILSAGDVCAIFDHGVATRPREITYYIRWATPEIPSHRPSPTRSWSWESEQSDKLHVTESSEASETYN